MGRLVTFIATSTIIFSSSFANAQSIIIGGGNKADCPDMYKQCLDRNLDRNKNRNALVGGIIGGIVGGIISNSRNRRIQRNNSQNTVQQQPRTIQQNPSGNRLSNEHYRYCLNEYKSYRPETNTYTTFSGKTRFCNSPFN